MAIRTKPANRRGTLPIGSVIPFYDFGAGGPGGAPLTFDGATWKYCDGTAIVAPGGVLHGQITPDLSGRYLVGFGTELGGNIGNPLLWSTVAVGNNTIDLSHTHTIANHFHTMAHTHSASTLVSSSIVTDYEPYHTHRIMTTAGYTYTYYTGSKTLVLWYTGGPDKSPEKNGADTDYDNYYTSSEHHRHSISFTEGGSTDQPSTANTSTKTAWVSNAASPALTGQDIRPRSMGVRYLMRIL